MRRKKKKTKSSGAVLHLVVRNGKLCNIPTAARSLSLFREAVQLFSVKKRHLWSQKFTISSSNSLEYPDQQVSMLWDPVRSSSPILFKLPKLQHEAPEKASRSLVSVRARVVCNGYSLS